MGKPEGSNSTGNAVSVLIPLYRAGKYIAECIESVEKQDLVKEIIVLNDGSDDDSLEQAQKAAQRFGKAVPVTVLDGPHRGQAPARNRLKEKASGELIFYVDADDVLCDGAVHTLAEAMEDTQADIVCARCRDFISPDLTDEEAKMLEIRGDPYPRNLAGCTLIRRSAFDRVGDYNEAMTSSETAEWMLRAKSAGLKIINIDAVTLRRRYHTMNFGRLSRNTQRENYLEIIRRQMRLKNGQQPDLRDQDANN